MLIYISSSHSAYHFDDRAKMTTRVDRPDFRQIEAVGKLAGPDV